MLLTITLLALPPTLLYLIYYPPKSLFSLLNYIYPSVLFNIPLPPTHRHIALTIDDVPSPHTAAILDSLKKYQSTATFFIIGDQVPGHEHLLQRILDEGHELGNHCWSDEKSIFRSLPALSAQLKNVEALFPSSWPPIKNGKARKWFRPGGGFFTSAMVECVGKMGYETVLGDVYPHDVHVSDAEWNAGFVVSRVREGSVVVLHDRRGWSAEEVELVLRGLKRGGWEVGSLERIMDVWEGLKAEEVLGGAVKGKID